MELIPVIDLRHSQAVMAIRGQRECYRPLSTPLCQGSDPIRVVSAFWQIVSFCTLYVADLDAILQTGDNGIIIERIHQAFPHLHLWVDRGWPPIHSTSRITPVIGSESLGPGWKHALATLKGSWILSLDFSATDFLGPQDLLEASEWWPPLVILMTLAKVGSQSGPDWARLRTFTKRYPNTNWIAAGGIRHQQDLLRLKKFGIRRALVASAIHYGRIRL